MFLDIKKGATKENLKFHQTFKIEVILQYFSKKEERKEKKGSAVVIGQSKAHVDELNNKFRPKFYTYNQPLPFSWTAWEKKLGANSVGRI